MNRAIGYAVILIAILMILGKNTSGFIGMLGMVFLLFAAFHLMIKRQLPKSFGSNFLLLILGPVVLTSLICAMLNSFSDLPIRGNWVLLLLIFAVFSLGCYWWQTRQRRREIQSRLRNNEREFIVPFEDYSNHYRRSNERDEL